MRMGFRSHFNNRSGTPRFFLTLAGMFVVFTICLVVTFLMRTGDDRIKQAEDIYRQGELASNIAQRKDAFNQSLDLFLQMELEYRPNFGTGRLYYDIGNTFFQLEEYPMAILYYLRSEKLMPRDGYIDRNLAVARQKLGISSVDKKTIIDFLLPSHYLSLPEQLQLFSLAMVLLFVLASGWVWTRNPLFLKGAAVVLAIALFFTISIGSIRYFSPTHAVLIHAAELRRDAGTAFATVRAAPIPAGTVVDILGTSPDADWVKIVAASGEFGYVPQTSVRLP